MNPLGDFSTEALLRELARRNDGEQHLKPVTRWCENCTHWRNSTSDTDTRNNCTRDHTMEFRMPESPYSEDYGFYRRGCHDWSRRVDDGRPSAFALLPAEPKALRGNRPRRAT